MDLVLLNAVRGDLAQPVDVGLLPNEFEEVVANCLVARNSGRTVVGLGIGLEFL